MLVIVIIIFAGALGYFFLMNKVELPAPVSVVSPQQTNIALRDSQIPPTDIDQKVSMPVPTTGRYISKDTDIFFDYKPGTSGYTVLEQKTGGFDDQIQIAVLKTSEISLNPKLRSTGINILTYTNSSYRGQTSLQWAQRDPRSNLVQCGCDYKKITVGGSDAIQYFWPAHDLMTKRIVMVGDEPTIKEELSRNPDGTTVHFSDQYIIIVVRGDMASTITYSYKTKSDRDDLETLIKSIGFK